MAFTLSACFVFLTVAFISSFPAPILTRRKNKSHKLTSVWATATSAVPSGNIPDTEIITTYRNCVTSAALLTLSSDWSRFLCRTQRHPWCHRGMKKEKKQWCYGILRCTQDVCHTVFECLATKWWCSPAWSLSGPAELKGCPRVCVPVEKYLCL